jgi:hypothetical protein
MQWKAQQKVRRTRWQALQAKPLAHVAERYADSMITVDEAVEGESNSTSETEDKQMEAAEGVEGNKMTIEEREAKLARLRKKFVCVSIPCLNTQTRQSLLIDFC